MSTLYPSDLSDDEWKHLQQYLPADPSSGRPRTHTSRAICNAIFYVLKTGCPWRYLPSNFPRFPVGVLPLSTLASQRELASTFHSSSSSRTRTSRLEHRTQCSNHGLVIRVKTVEESASICGFDAHKHTKGRKRHLLVDTLGLPLSVYVTPADVHDTRGARSLLAGLAPLVPRLKKIWADGAYRGQELSSWCKEEGDWDLEVVERAPGVRGFSIQPRRWVVERTFGWLSRSRRDTARITSARCKPAKRLSR